jgi:hypothetical protein
MALFPERGTRWLEVREWVNYSLCIFNTLKGYDCVTISDAKTNRKKRQKWLRISNIVEKKPILTEISSIK